MDEQGYDFQAIETRTFKYEFISVSDKKSIKKRIEYRLLDKPTLLYNLSLVDLMGEKASDTSISNNQDMPKILITVYKTMLDFFEKNARAKVFFSREYAQPKSFVQDCHS